jgi:hypothetical protein
MHLGLNLRDALLDLFALPKLVSLIRRMSDVGAQLPVRVSLRQPFSDQVGEAFVETIFKARHKRGRDHL